MFYTWKRLGYLDMLVTLGIIYTNYLTWFNSIDYYKLNEGEAQVFVVLVV